MRFERIAGIATAVVVAGGLAAGFLATGSPGHQRAVQMDERRVDDLRTWAARIDQRYGAERSGHALPARLVQADRPRRDDGSDGTRDPVSGQPYAYVREDARNYRLCATFATTLKAGDQGYDSWPHRSGRACWRFDVALPVTQSPPEPPPQENPPG